MTTTNTRRYLSAKWEADNLSITEHKELLGMGGYEPSPTDKISVPTRFDAASSLFYNDNEKGNPRFPRATILSEEGNALSVSGRYILLVRGYCERREHITVTGGDADKGIDSALLERIDAHLLPSAFNLINGAIDGNQDPYEEITITPYLAKYIFGCGKKQVKEGMVHIKIGRAIFNITYIQNLLKFYYYFFGKNADMVIKIAEDKVAYVNTDNIFMGLMPMTGNVGKKYTRSDDYMLFDLNSIPTNPSGDYIKSKEEADPAVMYRVNDDGSKCTYRGWVYDEEYSTVTLLVDKEEMELESRIYNETTRYGLKLTKKALRSLYDELSKMKLNNII